MDPFAMLTGQLFTPEELVGRNYAHYTHGLRDGVQPCQIVWDDLPLEQAEDGEEADPLLAACVPADCWIRHLSAANGGEDGFYLIVLTLDDHHRVQETALWKAHLGGVNRSWISFPGTDALTVLSYEAVPTAPDFVLRELQALQRRRILPLHPVLIGAPFPRSLAQAGVWDLEQPSALRQAVMHLSVETDGAGRIAAVDYSTWPASGDDWGDMCSRPHPLEDAPEEAADLLLWLIDSCTDGEYRQFRDGAAG